MSKEEVIRILENKKKPICVTQLIKLMGKSRSTINSNIYKLLREPICLIKFIEKKGTKYGQFKLIRYYYLVKKRK